MGNEKRGEDEGLVPAPLPSLRTPPIKIMVICKPQKTPQTVVAHLPTIVNWCTNLCDLISTGWLLTGQMVARHLALAKWRLYKESSLRILQKCIIITENSRVRVIFGDCSTVAENKLFLGATTKYNAYLFYVRQNGAAKNKLLLAENTYFRHFQTTKKFVIFLQCLVIMDQLLLN